MFPFLKLQSSDCTVYLKISRLRKDEEWIDFSIELRSEELLVSSRKTLLYYSEPNILLSIVDSFLDEHNSNEYELIDDPTVEFVFDSSKLKMILRLYRGYGLEDHEAYYMDMDQVKYLDKYLKLYNNKLDKSSKDIQELYNQGILQGD